MTVHRPLPVEAILLGTAQDAGVPQAGCDCPSCARAHADPEARRWVACLGLVDHSARQSWLLDATPDLREQLHALQHMAPDCELAGIALTHAHIGHYTGLIHLGPEAMNTKGMPVYASERMADFLRTNLPWSHLIAAGNMEIRPLTPTGSSARSAVPGEVLRLRSGQTVGGDAETQLSPNLSLTPLPVPHRDEFSDTLAFVVHGPERKLFYCPDIDAWERWEHNVREFVDCMDVALLDACFFSADELPGRDTSQIPHPLATDTAERLAGVGCDVRLIHLNHSNPLHAPGPEREWLAECGLNVGQFGDRWTL